MNKLSPMYDTWHLDLKKGVVVFAFVLSLYENFPYLR